MIKDAIIITLLLILAVLALGTAEKPEAVIAAPTIKADWTDCRPSPGPPLIPPVSTPEGEKPTTSEIV